jgi:hypothetical protein
VICAAVVLVIVAVVGGVGGAGGAAGDPPAVRARGSKEPAVILELAGSGSRRSESIQLPGRWALKWSFDCRPPSIAGPGVFSVEVIRAHGRPRRDPQIPRLLRFDTAGSGLERYGGGGYRAFLRIASQCPWTLRATRIRA